MPFVLASGFIADTASLPLVVSNLVNIVSADYFHIGFVSYARHMVVPNLFSVAASMAVLYLFFHRDIPKRYDPAALSDPSGAVVHREMFRLSWLILAILMAGYLGSELWHLPVSLVAGGMAGVFLAVGRRAKVIRPWDVVRGAPWAIVVFSIGMYVVVYGLRNAGLTQVLGQVMESATRGGLYAATLAAGFLAAFLSSVMNNMPAVMTGALVIDATMTVGVMRRALVYANVVGCDLGPKMTPIGSLATLLWLHVLNRRGVTITWGQYVRIGLMLTIPTLFIALSGLYLWLRVTE